MMNSLFAIGFFFSINLCAALQEDVNKVVKTGSLATTSLLKKGFIDNFGQAFLKRIRNSTKYPLEIDLEQIDTKNLLPDNSLVKIRSKSDLFPDAKPYFAVEEVFLSQNNTAKQLVIKDNEFDGSKRSVLFRVSNITDKEGQSWITFTSVLFPDKHLMIDSFNQDKHSVICASYNIWDLQNQINPAWWKLEGSINRAYLKNSVSGGYLGPLDLSDDLLKDRLDKNYFTLLNENLTDQQAAVFKNKSLSDLLLLALDKLDTALLVFFEALRICIKDPSLRNIDGLAKLEKAVQDTFLRMPSKENLQECCFGDLVRIGNFASFQNIGIDGANDSVFLGSEDLDQKSCLFMIKGPHLDNDRYNCSFGASVKQGALIRLENIKLSKNLSLASQKIDSSELIKLSKDKNENDVDKYRIFLSGKAGIGSSQDDWYITFFDSEKTLKLGSRFMLMHATSGAFLCGDLCFVKNQASILQQICGLKNKEKDIASQQKESIGLSLQSADIAMKDVVNDTGSSANKNNISLSDKSFAGDSYLNNKLWYVDKLETQLINQKNLARTGYIKGAAYDRIGTNIPNNQQVEIEVVSFGGKNIIPSLSDLWTDEINLSSGFDLSKQTLVFNGLYSTDQLVLYPGSSLTVPPLLNTGVIWIEKSLIQKNIFGLKFFVRLKDRGDITIVIGNSLSSDFEYKVHLTANPSKKSSISKKLITETGEVVEKNLCEVSLSSEENLIIRAGETLPIWFSYNKGLFVLGKSANLGESPFLIFRDKDLSNDITRVGFSCDQKSVDLSNIEMSSYVQIAKPVRKYKKAEIPVSKDESITLTEEGIRQKNDIVVELETSGSRLEEIILGSTLNKSIVYKLSLDFISGEILLRKKIDDFYKTVFQTTNNLLPTKRSINSKIWLSFREGLFIAGLNSVGEDPLFCFQDSAFKEEVNALGVGVGSSISLGQFYSPIFFERIMPADQRLFLLDLASLTLVGSLPFRYRVFQDDDKLMIQEMVSKKSFMVATMPQQGADYSFMLEFSEDGFPKARWLWQPENENLVKKQWQLQMLTASSEALRLSSGHIEGSGATGQAVGAMASTAAAGASLQLAYDAASLKADLAVAKGTEVDKVATAMSQKVEKQIDIEADISVSARRNRLVLENRLNELLRVTPSTEEYFGLMLGKYKEIVGLIDHSYVVATAQVKQQIISGVEELFQYYKTVFPSDSPKSSVFKKDLIGLLLSFVQNNYFFNKSLTADVSKQKNWMSKASSLAIKSDLKQMQLPDLGGLFFWLSKKLPAFEQGEFEFDAKGSGSLSIAISASPFFYFDSKLEIYEISILNQDFVTDITAALRLFHGGAVAAGSLVEEASINSSLLKHYKVVIKDGLISLFLKNAEDEFEKVFAYQDPFPTKTKSYLGVASWGGEIEIMNFSIK